MKPEDFVREYEGRWGWKLSESQAAVWYERIRALRDEDVIAAMDALEQQQAAREAEGGRVSAPQIRNIEHAVRAARAQRNGINRDEPHEQCALCKGTGQMYAYGSREEENETHLRRFRVGEFKHGPPEARVIPCVCSRGEMAFKAMGRRARFDVLKHERLSAARQEVRNWRLNGLGDLMKKAKVESEVTLMPQLCALYAEISRQRVQAKKEES